MEEQQNYFQGSEIMDVVKSENTGIAAVVARTEGELKLKTYMAITRPRDEAKCFGKIIQSMGRPAMAQQATYNYPRANTNITGPSVYLARELARIWGNVQYELQIVSITDDEVHIRASVYDYETNTSVVMEDRFKKLIQRKKKDKYGNKAGTEWLQPDERELRELINKHGAICIRNAILQIIPPDITEDALKAAADTVKQVASGELRTDRKTFIKYAIKRFSAADVTVEMLDAYLGHSINDINEEEAVKLNGICRSIEDGNTKVEDHFNYIRNSCAVETASVNLDEIQGKNAPLKTRGRPRKEDVKTPTDLFDNEAERRRQLITDISDDQMYLNGSKITDEAVAALMEIPLADLEARYEAIHHQASLKADKELV